MSVIISGKGGFYSFAETEIQKRGVSNAELMILVNMLMAIPKSLLNLEENSLVQLYTGIRLCMMDFLTSTCNATS